MSTVLTGPDEYVCVCVCRHLLLFFLSFLFVASPHVIPHMLRTLDVSSPRIATNQLSLPRGAAFVSSSARQPQYAPQKKKKKMLSHATPNSLFIRLSLRFRRDQNLVSTVNCWYLVLEQTRRESRDHATLSDIYNNNVIVRLAHVGEDVIRLFKKVRAGMEAGEGAQSRGGLTPRQEIYVKICSPMSSGVHVETQA